MALFTDANIITLGELLQFETTLVQIASTHGINVDTKINLATSALADKLMLWLLDVGISDPQWMTRRVIGLSTVVVTPPLRRWLCFESLSRFFAEAYNVQLNTRFEGKWTEYRQESQSAGVLAQSAGVGIVYNPLPEPAMPLVSVQTGNAPAQSMFVQTAWVNTLGDEGALSPVNGLILANDSAIKVAMAEGIVEAPPAALGWNVYITAGQLPTSKQNTSVVPLGATWALPSTGLVSGSPPVNGQSPDFYVTISKQILRG